jgi:membrane complex biogenesis BtpA family protein
MTSRTALFSVTKPVIAMVHLAALPGTPVNRFSLSQIEKQALNDAKIFRAAGVHGVMLENMHDTPYLRGRVGPEIVASMAIIARAVKQGSGLPCGVQVLAGANLEAMAVAHAAGLDFIRAEGFAFAHVADEGIIESSAAELLRYRRNIGADGVQVWTDIKKKHRKTYEFTDQYDSVKGIYLGIGVVEVSKEDLIFPMFNTHYHRHFDFNGRNGGN